MGSKKGEGGHYLPDNPSVSLRLPAPFSREPCINKALVRVMRLAMRRV